MSATPVEPALSPAETIELPEGVTCEYMRGCDLPANRYVTATHEACGYVKASPSCEECARAAMQMPVARPSVKFNCPGCDQYITLGTLVMTIKAIS